MTLKNAERFETDVLIMERVPLTKSWQTFNLLLIVLFFDF